MIDLDAYFKRIGYWGACAPTLETLDGIVFRHVQSIPFENLDVLLGRPIELDEASLENKLIHQRRGGYCFEQNTLLLGVLTQLGFEVRPLSARVRYQRPRDFTPARTHLFVRVELDGVSRLADVGVGTMSPAKSLKLDERGEQETPHETRRLLRENGLIYHQALLGSQWADICEFTLEEMPVIDRVVANWFTSTHPDSHFRHRLLVARATSDGGRITLLNRELSIRDRSGHSQKQLIGTPEQLVEVLSTHFNFDFSKETRFTCLGLDWPAS